MKSHVYVVVNFMQTVKDVMTRVCELIGEWPEVEMSDSFEVKRDMESESCLRAHPCYRTIDKFTRAEMFRLGFEAGSNWSRHYTLTQDPLVLKLVDKIESSYDWLNRACEMNSDNEDAYSYIRGELKTALAEFKDAVERMK